MKNKQGEEEVYGMISIKLLIIYGDNQCHCNDPQSVVSSKSFRGSIRSNYFHDNTKMLFAQF